MATIEGAIPRNPADPGRSKYGGKTEFDNDLTLAAGDVGTTELAADAVTAAKLADDAVTNDNLSTPLPKTLEFQYDFADLGGAAGALTLTDASDGAQTIPDNAVIRSVTLDALTTATSGGSATIALGYTGATTAFIAATAYNNGEFDAGACTALTAAHKTTAAVSVIATVATADLTAGKFNVYVEYIEGD